MNRRMPAVVLAVLALVGAVAATRYQPEPYEATFGLFEAPWMPHAVESGEVTEAWFCPGIPATGIDDTGGILRIANRRGETATGTVVLFNDKSETRRIELNVSAFSVQEIDVATELKGEITSAVVEVAAGGTLVEQVSKTPTGNSIAPCSNTTSSNWYFADGYTVDASRERLLLSNPYDQPIVAKLTIAVASGARDQSNYRNIPVPARTVKIIDLGAVGSGVQDEAMVAISVTALRGQLAVGRVAEFSGGGRAGIQVSTASPALSDQWRFAGGRKGEGISERYSIYNPTDAPVEVETVILGSTAGVDADGNPVLVDIPTIPISAGHVAEFDPSTVDGFPDGDYAVVFSTLNAPSIVVERATTQTISGKTNTSVIAGATARPIDQYLPTQWQVPAGPAEGLDAALVVHNLDLTPGTLTVYAIGANGPVQVPGMIDLPLPSSDAITLVDLTAPEVLGRQLIIQTTNRTTVERWYRSGRGDTRTIAWAFPTGA